MNAAIFKLRKWLLKIFFYHLVIYCNFYINKELVIQILYFFTPALMWVLLIDESLWLIL
jgi:hypothetical protein